MFAVDTSITVIIATYNSEKYLEGCIQSIINQTYSNWELIVIDGGSIDNTIGIINAHSKYIKYWITEPDKGIYDAWNKALKKVSTNWVCFVGSDDILCLDALENYANHIKHHPLSDNLEFVSSNIDFVDENLNLIETVGSAWHWESFKKSMITWHVGCWHAFSLFNKYGFFDTTYKISGDYEFLLRPSSKLFASYFRKTTAKMRNGGLSSTQLISASRETYRAKIKNRVMSKSKGYFFMLFDDVRLRLRP